MTQISFAAIFQGVSGRIATRAKLNREGYTWDSPGKRLALTKKSLDFFTSLI